MHRTDSICEVITREEKKLPSATVPILGISKMCRISILLDYKTNRYISTYFALKNLNLFLVVLIKQIFYIN